MNTNDTMPEILENAEFVTIQFPSEKARAKRVIKKAALIGGASVIAMVAVLHVINRVDVNIPAAD